MATEEAKKLAIKIRKVLCLTDEYNREGSREVPIIDSWGDIEELIEDALGMYHGQLGSLGESGACQDEDCYVCFH